MKNLIRQISPWYRLMFLATFMGLAVYQYDTETGSWLMGVSAGIALTIAAPILRELIEYVNETYV